MKRLALFTVGAVVLVGLLGAAYIFWPKPAQLSVPESLTPSSGQPVLAILGDSYASGYAGYGSGMDGWPAQVASELGYGLRLNAQPGTGHLATVDRGTQPFPERASEATEGDPDVVIVAGSRNDEHEEPSEVAAAARETLATIEAEAPDAEVYVVGPMWAGDMPAKAQPIEDAVRAAAEDAGAVWIDGSDWLSGNPGEIAADEVHPNSSGHSAIADRIIGALTPTEG